jgi:hypothetical protein
MLVVFKFVHVSEHLCAGPLSRIKEICAVCSTFVELVTLSHELII